MQVYPPWKQAAIAAVGKFTYGDIITVEWMQEAFDLRPPVVGDMAAFNKYQFSFLSALDGFREKLLLDNLMYLKNVRGSGYLIVEVEDQTKIAWGSFKDKIRRELAKAEKVLTNINRDLLSDAGRTENHNKLALLSSIAAFNTKQLGEQNGIEVSGRKEADVSNKKAGRNGSRETDKKRSRGEKSLPLFSV